MSHHPFYVPPAFGMQAFMESAALAGDYTVPRPSGLLAG
jgi:hypothetical protein